MERKYSDKKAVTSLAKVYRKIKVMSGDLVEFNEETGEIIGFKHKKILDDDGNIIGFDISLMSKEEFDEFVLVIAGMISSFGLSFYLNKYLDKKLSKTVIESVVNNHIQATENEYYYLPLTRILLDEYFLLNDKIDLSCFIRYNVPGMKKEIKSISGYEVEMGGRLITANDGIDEQQVIIDRTTSSGSLEYMPALIATLGEKYKEIKDSVDMSANNILHVFMDGDTINLANNNFEPINYEYFENLFKVNLGWLKAGSKSETMTGMTTMVLFMETFVPNQIVLYSSLSDEFIKDAKFNVGLYNKNHDIDDQIDLFVSKAKLPGSIK